jgi:hypothetical protein
MTSMTDADHAHHPAAGPIAQLLAPLRTVLRRAAKLVSHPVRAYFNGHFEMTKAEIRAAAATRPASGVTDEAVLEVGNVVAETSVHQARMIGDLRERIETLTAEVEELRATVHQLTRVVADGLASTSDAP